MNRRKFIQSLAAVFTLPAAPKLALGSVGAAAPAVTAVPTQARFWAIYMSALHGECTPQTLQNLLHIPEADSKKYIGQLIADGVIKPNPILKNAVSELVKPKDDGLVDRVKKRFEKKAKAEPVKLDVREEADAETVFNEEPDVDDAHINGDVDTLPEDQPLRPEDEEAFAISSEEDSGR